MSKLEEELAMHLKAMKIPFVREFKFCETRKWRSDFAFVNAKLLVEAEGGIWNNGRHNRGNGYEADCEKYNVAGLLGFTVLRVTAKHIKSGQALQWIEEFLEKDDNEQISRCV